MDEILAKSPNNQDSYFGISTLAFWYDKLEKNHSE